MKRRVVITGLGAVTPIGNNVDDFWKNILAGVSGVGPIQAFDVGEYPTRIAAEVKDFNPEDYIDKKDIRRLDRFTHFAVAASIMAFKDSGINMEETNPERVGVYIGSGIGGLSTWEDNFKILLEKGPKRVSPFLIPMMIANMGSGQVSISLGAKGPNSSPVSACATGTHAIGDAVEIIRRGKADVMIAGGSEATIRPMALAGFSNMKAMSTRNDDPTKASRPFDKDRDGFVMGEGAGIVVLESLEHAKKRGAKIYAEVIGYGMSGDAYHQVQPAPEGEGAARAMSEAIADAGISPEEVDYINAHGTSTDFNDKYETAAIKKIFGEHAYRLAVSSTKSMTGHLLGAAGGIEAIVCVKAINDGIFPPTINYETPDPECDLDYVPNKAREGKIRVTMSNSLGFGGHNASIIIKAFEE